MKNRIKAVRQNTGLTQQEFARRIGVSRNTIATYETCERTPIDAIVRSCAMNLISMRPGSVPAREICI